jgi:dTDP-4-amino-4,6-dideoxygalactose transaminase
LYNASRKLPRSENCAQEVLSLPMFPELNQEEIGRIADVINNAS